MLWLLSLGVLPTPDCQFWGRRTLRAEPNSQPCLDPSEPPFPRLHSRDEGKIKWVDAGTPVFTRIYIPVGLKVQWHPKRASFFLANKRVEETPIVRGLWSIGPSRQAATDPQPYLQCRSLTNILNMFTDFLRASGSSYKPKDPDIPKSPVSIAIWISSPFDSPL